MDVRDCNPDLADLSDTSMLPLQDGTILLRHKKDNKDHVIRLSDRGEVITNLITTDKEITGLIKMSNNECLVLHEDSLQHVRIEDGQVLGSGYKVPDVGWLWDGIRIDDDQVLLVDYYKGEVITYNMKTRNKHVVIS